IGDGGSSGGGAGAACWADAVDAPKTSAIAPAAIAECRIGMAFLPGFLALLRSRKASRGHPIAASRGRPPLHFPSPSVGAVRGGGRGRRFIRPARGGGGAGVGVTQRRARPRSSPTLRPFVISRHRARALPCALPPFASSPNSRADRHRHPYPALPHRWGRVLRA